MFCIDWLEPLRNTGQWTPELVELAGGEEGLAEKWGKSREVGWDEVVDYQPDYVMVMPCAFNMDRTILETSRLMPSGRSGIRWTPSGKAGCTCSMARYPAGTGPG